MGKYNYINEWNNTHRKHNMGKIISDEWLGEYEDYIVGCDGFFLDLGCGSGNDTLMLMKKYGKKVISADFSDVAIALLEQKVPEVQTKQFDMVEGIPFENNTFSFIISDLSLQYFSCIDTCKIVDEVYRVLKKEGYLLVRLSAVDDFNYGAMSGEELEYHYYYIEKRNKRYYDIDDIYSFFSNWKILNVTKSVLTEGRYKYPRSVYVALLTPNEFFTGTKILFDDKIILRHLRMNDAEQMYRGWTSDEEVTKYVVWKKHESLDDTKKILDKWINSYSEWKKVWGIEYEGCLVGTISVVAEKNDECEVGYVIAREYWNRGIATRALKLVIDYLGSIGYRKVYAEFFSNNIASGKVMKKVGMQCINRTVMMLNQKTGREENVIRYEFKTKL